MKTSALSQEWCLLQNQFDSYEKYSLLIKLVSIVLCFFSLLVATELFINFVFVLTVFAILWLQDAIWKTFQARIEHRLLTIEAAIKTNEQASQEAKSSTNAFQFNQSFLETRGSSGSLMTQYLKQALRPTIAFPHLIIIVLLSVRYFLF